MLGLLVGALLSFFGLLAFARRGSFRGRQGYVVFTAAWLFLLIGAIVMSIGSSWAFGITVWLCWISLVGFGLAYWKALSSKSVKPAKTVKDGRRARKPVLRSPQIILALLNGFLFTAAATAATAALLPLALDDRALLATALLPVYWAVATTWLFAEPRWGRANIALAASSVAAILMVIV